MTLPKRFPRTLPCGEGPLNTGHPSPKADNLSPAANHGWGLFPNGGE